jgi:hypothetical protein
LKIRKIKKIKKNKKKSNKRERGRHFSLHPHPSTMQLLQQFVDGTLSFEDMKPMKIEDQEKWYNDIMEDMTRQHVMVSMMHMSSLRNTLRGCRTWCP